MNRAASTTMMTLLAVTLVAVLSACSRDEPQAVLARAQDDHADDHADDEALHRSSEEALGV